MTEDQVIEQADGPCHHMMYASFHITSDRAISNEFMRHRASFSQEPVPYPGHVQFCVPHHLQDSVQGVFSKDKILQRKLAEEVSDGTETKIFKESCASAYQNYLDYLEHSPSTIARGCLPLFLKTEYLATNTLQGWSNFVHYKGDISAHQDIRMQIATGIQQELIARYKGYGICPKQLHQYQRINPQTFDEILNAIA